MKNEPAFPNVKYNFRKNPDPKGYEPEFYDISTGLTKREYFAGLAMQGLCANSSTYDWPIKDVSSISIKFANSLIKELSKDD